jgi:hypothetical protein
MSPERIRKLEGIGFVWNDVAQSWDVMYQKLREYIEQVSHYLLIMHAFYS